MCCFDLSYRLNNKIVVFKVSFLILIGLITVSDAILAGGQKGSK